MYKVFNKVVTMLNKCLQVWSVKLFICASFSIASCFIFCDNYTINKGYILNTACDMKMKCFKNHHNCV